MSISEPGSVVNYLLQGLPAALRKEFMVACEPVTLEFGTWLCEPAQPLEHAYFPLTGFISLITTTNPSHPLELGLIGNEGMLGATLVLGINIMPMGALVQGKGTALRIHQKHLQHALQLPSPLSERLNRYLYVVIAQLAQTAACIHFHDIEQRLARWLLMTHDRAHASHFHLTQKFLADMLGVRRSGITIAANRFQDRQLIHYTRGEIHIINRKGLESASCECYSREKKIHEKILGANKNLSP
jgi:CRP-like cAMP-binding protein